MSIAKKVNIRQARIEDLPAILALQHRCYEKRFHESYSSFQTKLTQVPNLSWVVYQQEQLLAYFICLAVSTEQFPCLNDAFYQSPSDATALYLHDMSIAQEMRGQGLAQQLLSKVWRQAQSLGLREAFLIAVQQSHTVWAKKGFSVVDAQQHGLLESLKTYGAEARLMYQKIKLVCHKNNIVKIN